MKYGVCGAMERGCDGAVVQCEDPESGAWCGRTFEHACTQEWADGCYRLAQLYWRGEWTARDVTQANNYRHKACELGLAEACASFDDREPQQTR